MPKGVEHQIKVANITGKNGVESLMPKGVEHFYAHLRQPFFDRVESLMPKGVEHLYHPHWCIWQYQC